jgi:hypothetical protein
MYQRYAQGDLKQKDGEKFVDTEGVGFPLMPVFFPIQHNSMYSPFTQETYPLTQAVSAGLWCLTHMQDI